MGNLLARPGNVALAALFSLLLSCILILASAASGHTDRWMASRRLVRELRLTDLCLVTEARYTRHLSQADHHAPFQEHPMGLEHFPSGSLLSPPHHLIGHAPLAR